MLRGENGFILPFNLEYYPESDFEQADKEILCASSRSLSKMVNLDNEAVSI